MPWCESCSRYLAPPAVEADGTCPTCGRMVEVAAVATRESGEAGVESPTAEREERSAGEPWPPQVVDPKPPWHFWVLVAGVVLYLGWRLIQGIALLVDSII